MLWMSGPEVNVCKFRYNTIIWRAENVPTLEHRQLFICYVLRLFAMRALYLLFLPPLLLSGSLDDRCRCPCDRLHRLRLYRYRRATRQAEPLPLSLISPTFLYLSVALGICCCYVISLFYCIACHCRPLITFSDILCSLIYIIYTAVDPALCQSQVSQRAVITLGVIVELYIYI